MLLCIFILSEITSAEKDKSKFKVDRNKVTMPHFLKMSFCVPLHDYFFVNIVM